MRSTCRNNKFTSTISINIKSFIINSIVSNIITSDRIPFQEAHTWCAEVAFKLFIQILSNAEIIYLFYESLEFLWLCIWYRVSEIMQRKCTALHSSLNLHQLNRSYKSWFTCLPHMTVKFLPIKNQLRLGHQWKVVYGK